MDRLLCCKHTLATLDPTFFPVPLFRPVFDEKDSNFKEVVRVARPDFRPIAGEGGTYAFLSVLGHKGRLTWSDSD